MDIFHEIFSFQIKEIRKIDMKFSCGLFFCSLLYLAAVEYYEVNGLAFDDFDFVRSTIEAATKNITSKPATKFVTLYTVKQRLLGLRSSGFHGPEAESLKASLSILQLPLNHLRPKIESRNQTEFNKFGYSTAAKPRNLNKFNEAMDQVERAMAQAELSRKTAKLTDLKKDITNAVNRGNVR